MSILIRSFSLRELVARVKTVLRRGRPRENQLPHIFEGYFKKDERGASGLGLAIVKRIIDLHGSSIDVKSTVGKGTSFQFALPVAQLA